MRFKTFKRFFKLRTIVVFLLCFSENIFAQASAAGYWQQKADYTMDVKVNVKTHTYKASQELTYYNNSPDTISRVFYHLYYRAFQPGSGMDLRSQSLQDPDPRVDGRISKLTKKEIGDIQISSLKQEGKALTFEVVGTVLEVSLAAPLLPNSKTVFSMDWKAQIPLQIRRTGRDNKEGIALSMTQWYPKIAEYDHEGWHAYPYLGREFHGVWGSYDVTLTLDADYTVAASGVLQNPTQWHKGYEITKEEVDLELSKKKPKKLTWHFIAENVHDFAWAADPDYLHDTLETSNNRKLHFFYKDTPALKTTWKKLQPITKELLGYFEKHIGAYPYPQYSVIQGGDGGMEYAMCTLITGERSFESLVGVTAHELAHSWFQHVLATNESKHEWMDEGFTTYISSLAVNAVLGKSKDAVHKNSYNTYKRLVNSGLEEPQTTHADRYACNFAYGASAYAKGALFLDQLGYIVGEDTLQKILKTYYSQWKFKHPSPTDFIRVAEKVSGMHLGWYLLDWTQTTRFIDYGIKSVVSEKRKTQITLERNGQMPMPVEFQVVLKNGGVKKYYIPLEMQRGVKTHKTPVIRLKDWSFAAPSYAITLKIPLEEIKSVVLFPSNNVADITGSNNVFYPKND